MSAPKAKPTVDESRIALCENGRNAGRLLLTGISKVLADIPVGKEVQGIDKESQLVMLIDNNRISCINTYSACSSILSHDDEDETITIDLEDGYVTPGLIAIGNNLGIQDISSEPSTGDWSADSDALASHSTACISAGEVLDEHGLAA